MQSMEFEAVINDNSINLPGHLKNLNHKRVRVIIMHDDSGPRGKKLPRGFYNPLHASTYRVIGNREEIYER